MIYRTLGRTGLRVSQLGFGAMRLPMKGEITLQYNMFDRSLEDGIAHAKEKAIGIVVMGPVGGGRLGADSEVLSRLLPQVRRVPELALRFVLATWPSETRHRTGAAIAGDARRSARSGFRFRNSWRNAPRRWGDAQAHAAAYERTST